MAFDHAQSPRLGQRTPVENPGVQLCTLETLPEVAYRGQIVYVFDENTFGVYDGTTWELPGGGDAINMFVQPTEPVADNIGDQWLNTNEYQIYVWNGDLWVPTGALRTMENQRATLMLAVAARKITPAGEHVVDIFYQSSTPASGTQYDLWEHTGTNTLYQYNGGWNQIFDPDVSNAIHDAGLDRFLADEAITMYFQEDEPTGLGPEAIGDGWIWQNVIKSWTGAAWVNTQVTEGGLFPGSVTGVEVAQLTIDTQHIAPNAIDTSKIVNNAINSSKLANFVVSPLKMVDMKYRIY